MLIRWYFKEKRTYLVLNLSFLLIFCGIFYLYGLSLEPIFYSVFICLWIMGFYLLCDFLKFRNKYQILNQLKNQIDVHLIELPKPSTLSEFMYQDSLTQLHEHRKNLNDHFEKQQVEMMDYYTMWAHQIKTPIAAMRLLAQSELSEFSKEVLGQLFKIEQYVEMVLGFLRIESLSSDLRIQKYELSDIVKQGIRKYANQFIRKNIVLEFDEIHAVVLTDEKWLLFVIEQLLSNALKYTNSGKIKIYMEASSDQILVIEDTGIGIYDDDLPRIFEKGFTGYNGRMDKKASGIGLYLCQKILKKLGHRICISSTVNIGTTVRINLTSKQIRYE